MMPRLAVTLAAVLALSAPAFAGGVSTYTKVAGCADQSDPDVDDSFGLFCSGPKGAAAYLGYWDNHAFVAFGWRKGSRVVARHGGEPDVSENFVVGRGPDVFGKLVEWRAPRGGAPCAGIIRAFTNQGQRLLVMGLNGEGHVGSVQTNEQAQALADRVCGL